MAKNHTINYVIDMRTPLDFFFEKIAVTNEQLAKEYEINVRPHLVRKRYKGLTAAAISGMGIPKTTILIKGDQLNDMIDNAGLKIKNKPHHEARKSVNYINALHEGDERKLLDMPWDKRPRTSGKGAHAGIEVLLREHNRVATLQAPEADKVRKLFGRVTDRDDMKSIMPGFRHGSSPRLSRHAIKNIIKSFK